MNAALRAPQAHDDAASADDDISTFEAKSLASTKASNRPAPRKSHQLIQYLENLASGSRGAPGLSLPRSWSCCHLRGQLRSRPLAYSLSRVHVW